MKKLTLLILACASALSLFGQDSTPEMLKKKQFFDKPDLFEAQSIFADRKANEELVKEYEKSPKSYAANQLFPIAVCYTTLGDLDSAEKLLKEYIKAEPKSIRALRMLGGIYFASRKADDAKGNEQKIASAIECYKKMLELGDKTAANQLASVYIIQQAPDKISEVLPQLKELAKTNMESLVLGFIYALRDGKSDDALIKELLSAADARKVLATANRESLQTVLRLYIAKRDIWPDSALVLPGRAAAFAEAWPLALDIYKKALKSDPKNTLAMRGLSLVYYRTGDIQTAVDYIKQAIAAGDKAAASDGVEIFLLTGDKSIWETFKDTFKEIPVSMVVRVGMIQYAEARDSADVFFAACEGEGSQAIFDERRLDKLVFDGLEKFKSDARANAVRERWTKAGGSKESVAKIEAQIAAAQNPNAEPAKPAAVPDAKPAQDDIGASLDKALKK